MKRKRIDFQIGKISKKQKVDGEYKVPDFSVLTRKYPEVISLLMNGNIFLTCLNVNQFSKHVENGRIDYTNPESIIVLTKTILIDQFNVKFDFPNSKFLCPRVPNRLNYIHFIQKLMSISAEMEEGRKIVGIDIGTGASAIYPLLGKSVFGWSFVATEVDPEAIEIARGIISSNGVDYEESIRVIHVTNPKHILQPNILPVVPNQFHFCMCNPPFFSNMEEGERNHPRRICKATGSELVTEGGEIEFVKTIIDDSLILKNRVRWYSSMLGRSSSLNPILDYLRSKNILNFVTSEFHQGKIIRYAVAWNFFHPRPIWIRMTTNEMMLSVEVPRFFRPHWKLVENVENEIRQNMSGKFSSCSRNNDDNNPMEICLEVKGSDERIRVCVKPGTVKYSYKINVSTDSELVTYAYQDLYEYLNSVFNKKK